MMADKDNQQATSQQRPVRRYSDEQSVECIDDIAQEVAIALVYNGISHVVMMSTPGDLFDLALGFSLSEKIINSASEILEFSVTQQPLGIELAITIGSRAMWALKQQRRNITGRTGCGLCGAESLQQAMSNLPSRLGSVSQRTKAPLSEVNHHAIELAVANLQCHQPLQRQTGAVHGAAWCDSQGNIKLLREDIGRHNALDKLIGALNAPDCAISQRDLASGFVLISSRASYEMISKAHVAGMVMMVAVSAPTALAINIAQGVGLTLVGFARTGRHTLYS